MDHQNIQERATMTRSHFNDLTPKKALGYRFEMKVQDVLLSVGLKFFGNPSDPIEWQKKIGKGSDMQTSSWELECKFHNTREYPSWIKEHTIPRFCAKKLHIVITNNKEKYSSVCTDLLRSFNILLWDIDDLKNFLSIPSFTSIYNFIRDTNLSKSNNIHYKTNHDTYGLFTVPEQKNHVRNKRPLVLSKQKRNDSLEVLSQLSVLLANISFPTFLHITAIRKLRRELTKTLRHARG
jgi:hypothetical protein